VKPLLSKQKVMVFEAGHIYHIFNQGNNRQQIFFSDENYLFFKKKIREHVVPYADILAWCLMPNHFHLMVEVKNISQGFTPSETLTKKTLNDSIGIMLRSYTRAINIQEKRSGSLFRKETKATCLTKSDRIAPAWFTSMGITIINTAIPERQYPNICFNYIHSNPVKDGLVEKPEQWNFSSFREFLEKQDDMLVNAGIANSFELSIV
jgi:putative transposase